MTDPISAGSDAVLVTRIFDAPRDVVFRAWLEPEQLAAWWGPDFFHVPLESVLVEARVGGRYELTMVHDDSGTAFPVRCTIDELEPPELIVLRHAAAPELGLPVETITRAQFHDHGDKTRMTLSAGPYDERMRPMAEAGWEGQLGKLARLLAALSRAPR